MTRYSPAVETQMVTFYGSLREKDRRRYAAVEAAKLGFGGVEYIADLLGCDPKTIRQGRADLADLPDVPPEQVRKGGRKRCLDVIAKLRDHFQQVLRDYTAGDPMRENVHWTNLTQQQIADGLELAGMAVSTFVVRQLLDEYHYVKRQAQKKQPLGRHPDRDAQFQRIGQLRDEYQAAGQPVLSIDVKKKELLGDFYRPGACYADQPQMVLDHDFPSSASGKVIPHGIYDLAHNRGHMTLGISHDTTQFACDCLLLWWKQHGQSIFSNAKRLLLLCDTGGSNSCGYRFKADLQRVADQTGLEIRVAHYPPYASKYNPIEHRLFPHVTRACRGAIFRSLEIVRELMLGTHTETGLDVTVEVLKNLYETGRKVTRQLRDSLRVIWDEKLPKWNYTLLPGSSS